MDQVRYELAAAGHEEKPKHEKFQRAKNMVSTLVLLLVSGCVSAVLGYFFYHLDTPGGAVILFNLRIRFLPSRHLEWRHAKGWTLIEGNLGTNFPPKVLHYDVHSKNATFMRVRWANHAELETDWWKALRGVQCYQFRWKAATCVHSALEDCYSLEGAHWYGGGVYRDQQWTIERLDSPMAPYLTGNLTASQPYGRILNRLWLSSKGVAFYVDPHSPLWVSINGTGDNRICFRASYDDGPYWQPSAHTPVTLNYTMCAGPNMRAVHWYMTQTFFKPPPRAPTQKSLQIITNPIWFITPSDLLGGRIKVSQLLKSITELQRNFENLTQCKIAFNIDALVFDNQHSQKGLQRKIQNRSSNSTTPYARDFLGHLHTMGMRDLSLIVSPSAYIDRALRRDFVNQVVFREMEKFSLPPRIRWETSEEQLEQTTKQWFTTVVDKRRRQLSVSSFVFLGGQALSLPFYDVLIKGLRSPDYFTSMYQTQALRRDPDALLDAASGERLTLSSFLLMHEREWTWGSCNGLASIIPEALTLGLVGFPLLIAPRLSWRHSTQGAGGCLHSPPVATDPPPDVAELQEIYLHWLQIVTFFPSISFTLSSFTDVTLSPNVTHIVSELLTLRRTHTSRLVSVARAAHRQRLPVLRPVWWIAPGEPEAESIDDQFMLGNDLLVAPVVGPRHTWSRHIYLPRGTWLDVLRNVTVEGPVWLEDYTVEPTQVAHFILDDQS